MNFAIYQAFARIPLGIAVTIEFGGPLAITLTGAISASGTGARRAICLGYAVLAATGVVLLANGAAGHLNWAGVAWAVAAGAAWACYIIGSKTTGQRMPGASGLVVAMCVAAVAAAASATSRRAETFTNAADATEPNALAADAAQGALP